MDPILVVGANTVAGANLCVHWSEQFDVCGVAATSLRLSDCRVIVDPANDRAESIMEDVRPGTVVLCGPAARSAWESGTAALHERMVSDAGRWAGLAKAASARFAFVSSDAVFAGPWMFHDEDSSSQCPSPQAGLIRAAEAEVLKRHSGALVVRTNVFGWSPAQSGGWLETTLATIEARRAVEHDAVRHATPVLATDLAEILSRALDQRLEGVYHVSGAERVSPLGFAQRLAGQFNLPWLPIRHERALTESPLGFGAGECSLQTKKIRRDLCIPMPLLSEALDRLEAQQWNGHREKLASVASVQLRAA